MATQSSTSAKSFASARQSVIIRPRTAEQQGFIYHNFSDLKNLVKFVGSKPSIDEEGNLWFRKQMIPDNSVILRNSYGQVTDVLSFDKAEEQYTVVLDSEFKPEHANKVEKKEPSVKGGNGGGMTRNDLKDALTKAKIDFKSGLTKDQLQVLYNEKVSKK
jgi:hypothetical protein